MEPLFSLLRQISPLSRGLTKYLRENLELRQFTAGDRILKEGDMCRYINFIESGLVMSNHLLNGVEVTTYFNTENNIFMSVHGFLRQMPSRENIYALEDCNCWSLPHEKLMYIYKKFPEFNLHGRVLTEKYYLLADDIQYNLRMQRPENMYLNLSKNRPELLKRVPVKYLASYLNVSVRHYIRIKGKLATRKKQ